MKCKKCGSELVVVGYLGMLMATILGCPNPDCPINKSKETVNP